MKKLIYPLLILIIFAFCDSKRTETDKQSSTINKIENIYSLSDLINPSFVIMDGKRVYIEDGTSVKLFDRSNFKYIRAIGREGQGPGEFLDSATPQILPDLLLVSSSNKISFFTLAGEFVEDKKHTIFGSILKAINNKFVGYEWIFEEDFVAYYLYDSNFKAIKELHRGKALIHPSGQRDLFEIFFYDTYKDKIVVAQRDGFTIDIFDSNGNLIHSIRHEDKSVPFTNDDRAKVLRYWKEDRGYEQGQIKSLEKRTNFPDFYPSIHTCRIADGKIYIFTYEKRDNEKRDNNFKCLIYNIEGDYIKTSYIPLKMLAPNLAVPFAINGRNIYQLIYSMEDDDWKIQVNQIK